VRFVSNLDFDSRRCRWTAYLSRMLKAGGKHWARLALLALSLPLWCTLGAVHSGTAFGAPTHNTSTPDHIEAQPDHTGVPPDHTGVPPDHTSLPEQTAGLPDETEGPLAHTGVPLNRIDVPADTSIWRFTPPSPPVIPPLSTSTAPTSATIAPYQPTHPVTPPELRRHNYDGSDVPSFARSLASHSSDRQVVLVEIGDTHPSDAAVFLTSVRIQPAVLSKHLDVRLARGAGRFMPPLEISPFPYRADEPSPRGLVRIFAKTKALFDGFVECFRKILKRPSMRDRSISEIVAQARSDLRRLHPSSSDDDLVTYVMKDQLSVLEIVRVIFENITEAPV
jgi:hypothetical protein